MIRVHSRSFRRGAALLLMLTMTGGLSHAAADPAVPLDPAAWGSNRVGKAFPEFVTGDECLFCHRIKVGPTWSANRHQSTVRPSDLEPEALASLNSSVTTEPLAGLAEFILGRTNQLAFLKRSDAYGQLDILSARLQPARDGNKTRQTSASAGTPHWETRTFANQCAGCHTTAFDSGTGAFAAVSIGCVSCHGDVKLEHSTDTTKVLLAQQRNDPARVLMSICGSCHIRTGRSRSTGFPFPNNFFPGDNLFRDLDVDFSDQAIGKLNPVDRHVLQNVRDVVVRGGEALTCLSCHNVHLGSSLRHRRLQRQDVCWTCHDGGVNKLLPAWSERHSKVCGY